MWQYYFVVFLFFWLNWYDFIPFLSLNPPVLSLINILPHSTSFRCCTCKSLSLSSSTWTMGSKGMRSSEGEGPQGGGLGHGGDLPKEGGWGKGGTSSGQQCTAEGTMSVGRLISCSSQNKNMLFTSRSSGSYLV